MEFTDGVKIEIDGPKYEAIKLSDGWYVRGKGMLCPCDDMADCVDLIKSLEGGYTHTAPAPISMCRKSLYFDRFDICEAYYVYAMLHHGGQWSEEYLIFGRLSAMGFKPRPSLRNEDDLNENARAIYDALANIAVPA